VSQRKVSDAGEQTTNALRFSTPGRPTSTEDKIAMPRIRHPGAGALGLDRRRRIYWRPFTVSLIEAKVRAVASLNCPVSKVLNAAITLDAKLV
jgi:hypothetical protein